MSLPEDTVIFSNGSSSTKIGLAGDYSPTHVFPTVCGNVKTTDLLMNAQQGSNQKYGPYIGEDAIMKRGILKLSYPIGNGIIQNWDAMQAVWEHSFKLLDVDPCERSVMVTEHPFIPTIARDKITQVFFEHFNVNSFYASSTSVLALLDSGRQTGMSVHISSDSTYYTPVYYGERISHAILNGNIGGDNLTSYLLYLLEETGRKFISTSDKYLVQRIKEELCYVSSDYHNDMQKYYDKQGTEIDQTYILPDDSKITFGSPRFRAPEPLFNPSLVGFSMYGIIDNIYESIMTADPEIRGELFKNIVITGATAQLPGLGPRIQRELQERAGKSFEVNVIIPLDAKYSIFRGASMFATSDFCSSLFISKADYDEIGPSILNKASP